MSNGIMSAEEAKAWRDDGVDGTREEIARMADTIIALHSAVEERGASVAMLSREIASIKLALASVEAARLDAMRWKDLAERTVATNEGLCGDVLRSLGEAHDARYDRERIEAILGVCSRCERGVAANGETCSRCYGSGIEAASECVRLKRENDVILSRLREYVASEAAYGEARKAMSDAERRELYGAICAEEFSAISSACGAATARLDAARAAIDALIGEDK